MDKSDNLQHLHHHHHLFTHMDNFDNLHFRESPKHNNNIVLQDTVRLDTLPQDLHMVEVNNNFHRHRHHNKLARLYMVDYIHFALYKDHPNIFLLYGIFLLVDHILLLLIFLILVHHHLRTVLHNQPKYQCKGLPLVCVGIRIRMCMAPYHLAPIHLLPHMHRSRF